MNWEKLQLALEIVGFVIMIPIVIITSPFWIVVGICCSPFAFYDYVVAKSREQARKRNEETNRGKSSTLDRS